VSLFSAIHAEAFHDKSVVFLLSEVSIQVGSGPRSSGSRAGFAGRGAVRFVGLLLRSRSICLTCSNCQKTCPSSDLLPLTSFPVVGVEAERDALKVSESANSFVPMSEFVEDAVRETAAELPGQGLFTPVNEVGVASKVCIVVGYHCTSIIESGEEMMARVLVPSELTSVLLPLLIAYPYIDSCWIYPLHSGVPISGAPCVRPSSEAIGVCGVLSLVRPDLRACLGVPSRALSSCPGSREQDH
jgi:hypothetical protein